MYSLSMFATASPSTPLHYVPIKRRIAQEVCDTCPLPPNFTGDISLPMRVTPALWASNPNLGKVLIWNFPCLKFHVKMSIFICAFKN